MRTKTCGVCGMTAISDDPHFYGFAEVRGVYQVGFVDVCETCGKKASSFVNYYGFKKDSDLIKLNQFLCGGVFVMRQYSQLVNAGYY